MSSKTYKIRALVIKKTKLGEKDLIVTMVDEGGALVKGVAKGARKPGGSLAARIELFSTVDALMAKGRSLDVLCEARLVDAQDVPRELEQSTCAAPIAELLSLVAQPDLVQPRLFDMSRAAISHLTLGTKQPEKMLSVCAASLWKIMGQSGFRPSFVNCVVCGDVVEDKSNGIALSLVDGGLVCGSCPRPADALIVPLNIVRWCDAFIRSTFDEIETYDIDVQTTFDVLQLARLWVRTHTGRDLKSLDFLFTSGLF